MKKDDVLEKSRRAGKDEGVEYAENQGRKIGFIVSVIVIIVLAVYCRFVGEGATINAVLSVFWAQEATMSYRRFYVLKEKWVLLMAIVFTVCFVVDMVRYITATWR